jgi:hypothetical protein
VTKELPRLSFLTTLTKKDLFEQKNSQCSTLNSQLFRTFAGDLGNRPKKLLIEYL